MKRIRKSIVFPAPTVTKHGDMIYSFIFYHYIIFYCQGYTIIIWNVTCRLSFGFYSIVTPFSSFPSAFSAPLHPMLLYNIITRRVREGRGEEKQSTLSLSRSLGHRVDYIYISTQPDVKFNGSWRLYRLCVFQNIPCQEENELMNSCQIRWNIAANLKVCRCKFSFGCLLARYSTFEMKLPVVCKPLRTERELEMASKRDLAWAAARLPVA